MKNIFDDKLEAIKKGSSQAVAEVEAVNEKTSILSFVTPTEIVELPSRGKFYEIDHPLHNKESVEIKQMTAKEEDILTNKSFIKKGIMIDKLIESLLVDKSIPVGSLLVGDKNSIIVAARIAAYGPSYPLNVSCKECMSKNNVEINLEETVLKDINSIVFEDLSEFNIDVDKLIGGQIIISLPRTKWTIECGLMTGVHERQILALMERKKKVDPNAEMTLSEQVNIIISKVNGHSEPELIKAALDLMPAGDAKIIRNAYQKVSPDVKILKKFSCIACELEQEMEVPFTQEFFWPK